MSTTQDSAKPLPNGKSAPINNNKAAQSVPASPNGARNTAYNSIPNGKAPPATNGSQPNGNGVNGARDSKGRSPQQGPTKTDSSKEAIEITTTKDSSSEERLQWEKIGGFQEHAKFDPHFVTDAQIIRTYITETFYSDWYWSTGLMIGTCFFSWLIAKWRFGIFGFMFVLLSASSVYRAEFRRFTRNIRDDIQRNASAERLEKNAESMEWLNSFLAKFWVIYMPALSETVMTLANETLKDVAPGYGIDKLSLDEFTLGTKAPRINSIKSYTKKGKDIVEMDWAFSFTPNDTSDMTKKEIDKKIDPKVALGVTVGKAFVSKSLPILVEDMSCSGRMKVKLNLSLNFPHIKIVSIQLLEPPKIDFALKPVGGDMLGLDIMSLIPGLSTLITSLINSNAGPMLYAPNHLDIDVEEIMAAQSNDAIGVVAVTVKGVNDLKSVSHKGFNPYVQMFVANDAEKFVRTDVKLNTKTPRWNETKYILVSSLEQKLNLELHNFSNDQKKGSLFGIHEFELAELLQQEAIIDSNEPLELAGKKKGYINYDVRWFPVIKDEKSSTEDDSKEVETPDTEVGILKLTVHQAKKLDSTASLIGQLNPKAELFINGKSTKKYRTLKRQNEPSWEESAELLITQKSNTNIKLVISDTGSSEDVTIATLDTTLDTLVFNTIEGTDSHSLSSKGEVRISAVWKPVSLSGVSSAANYVPPIGVARLHIREGHDLLNLETVGKVDPYVKVLLNNRLSHQTVFYPDTLDPNFNDVIYLPINSQSQHVSLEVVDQQNMTKDRPLGSCDFPIGDFIHKDESGNLLFYDGSGKILKSPLSIKGKKAHGALSYSVSFLPSIPVYSLTELEELNDRKAKQAEKEKEYQAKVKEWEELYKKNPKKYEWVDVEEKDTFDENAKEKLSLDQLLTYRSGTLGINILKGKVKKADTFIQVLVDDLGSPCFTTGRSTARNVTLESGEAFIRDLPNSKLIFRNVKKQNVSEQSDILGEQTYNTIELLEKGYHKPYNVTIDGAYAEVRFEYIPAAIKLPPSETILDTGRAKIEILDGDDLPSHDRNGKSDPFVTITLDGLELFKTKPVKKTLSPKWNEGTTIPIPSRARSNLMLNVYDWDRAGKNDLLGSTKLDISNVKAVTSEIIQLPLDTQGTVRLRVTFVPEYIRPKTGAAEFGITLSSLAGVPLKGVGVAAGLATGVVGGGVGVATGVVGGGVSVATGAVGKGGSLLKGVLGGKKSRKSMDQSSESDAHSMKSGHSKQSKSTNKDKNDGGAIAAAQEEQGDDQQSTYTTKAKGKKHTRGTLIIKSGTNIGSHAQIKVSLAINEKLKEIYHTKTSKSVNQVITWDEETTFDAPQDAEVVFGGVLHRRLSKDQELGTASILLSEVIDSPRDVELGLGQGKIIVSFRYSPEPEEGHGNETPPPPGW